LTRPDRSIGCHPVYVEHSPFSRADTRLLAQE
jgi:hypothetical protein